MLSRCRSLRGNVDRNIFQGMTDTGKLVVVPYVGTWIEMSPGSSNSKAIVGRSLRGNVDRNLLRLPWPCTMWSRSLRGNVDRNSDVSGKMQQINVVPYVGTWIEISPPFSPARYRYCRSLRGNVDRNVLAVYAHPILYRRSLRGNVDRNYEKSHQVDGWMLSFPTWERG